MLQDRRGPNMSNSAGKMDYSPPGSYVHGILQERILQWAAIPFSRDWTWVSCLVGRFFTIWATRETPLIEMPNWLKAW